MTQDETDAAINRRVMELEILAYHTGLAYRHLSDPTRRKRIALALGADAVMPSRAVKPLPDTPRQHGQR